MSKSYWKSDFLDRLLIFLGYTLLWISYQELSTTSFGYLISFFFSLYKLFILLFPNTMIFLWHHRIFTIFIVGNVMFTINRVDVVSSLALVRINFYKVSKYCERWIILKFMKILMSTVRALMCKFAVVISFVISLYLFCG